MIYFADIKRKKGIKNDRIGLLARGVAENMGFISHLSPNKIMLMCVDPHITDEQWAARKAEFVARLQEEADKLT